MEDLNANITSLPSLGPFSKYEAEGVRGKLEFKWIGEVRRPMVVVLVPDRPLMRTLLSMIGSQGENGIAVKLDTAGNKALKQATEEVLGKVEPYSISGSLPLVRYLQDNDFDVQLCGYGLSSRYGSLHCHAYMRDGCSLMTPTLMADRYHADNEAADLNDFKKATQILSRVIAKLEAQ